VQARKDKTSSPSSECRREKKRPPRPRASAGEKEIKTSSPSSERKREREKVLNASRGEEMYTLGKLRHQIKSFSPSSEFRQDQDLLAVERAQA